MVSERERYPSWMYRQSAALPYRWRDGVLEVLLITSIKRRRWIVPKGIIEPGLTGQASAAKEALEEAGVAGTMAPEPVGSYHHRKWGGVCNVTVYPLRVTRELDSWEESALRQRRWVSVRDAIHLVDNAGLRSLIATLPEAV